MVCFTDVPLRHSSEHCKRYGRFGIAFQKLKLMNVGAQPVFYASHACKRDMDTIFHFLQEQVQQTTLPSNLFRALHRHFYFIQRLSDGRADGHDTFYYEREWRLGEQTLVPEEKLRRPNAKYWSQREGYPLTRANLSQRVISPILLSVGRISPSSLHHETAMARSRILMDFKLWHMRILSMRSTMRIDRKKLEN